MRIFKFVILGKVSQRLQKHSGDGIPPKFYYFGISSHLSGVCQNETKEKPNLVVCYYHFVDWLVDCSCLYRWRQLGQARWTPNHFHNVQSPHINRPSDSTLSYWDTVIFQSLFHFFFVSFWRFISTRETDEMFWVAFHFSIRFWIKKSNELSFKGNKLYSYMESNLKTKRKSCLCWRAHLL